VTLCSRFQLLNRRRRANSLQHLLLVGSDTEQSATTFLPVVLLLEMLTNPSLRVLASICHMENALDLCKFLRWVRTMNDPRLRDWAIPYTEFCTCLNRISQSVDRSQMCANNELLTIQMLSLSDSLRFIHRLSQKVTPNPPAVINELLHTKGS